MKIEKTMHCIASKEFPLKFYRCGNETDELEDDVLRTYESCVDELKTGILSRKEGEKINEYLWKDRN